MDASPRTWTCKCGNRLGIWARPTTPELRQEFPNGCLLLVAGAFKDEQDFANGVRVTCRCGDVNVWYWDKSVSSK